MTTIPGIQLSSRMIENTAQPLDAKMRLSTPDRYDLSTVQRWVGMLCYDIDTDIWMQLINEPGTTSTTSADWIEFSGSGGGGGGIIVYGAFFHSYFSPITINSPSQTYPQRDFTDWINFDTNYTKCLVKFKQVISSTTTEVIGGPFASMAALYEWTSTNLITYTSGGNEYYKGTTFAEIYDEIDGSITPLAKGYGLNTLYGSIAGRKNGKSNKTGIAETESSSNYFPLYKKFYEEGVQKVLGYTSYTYDSKDNTHNLFWLGRNWRKKYGMPPEEGFVNNGGNVVAQRGSYDGGVNFIAPSSTSTGNWYINQEESKYCFYDVDNRAVLVWIDKHDLYTLKKYLNNKSFSGVCCYKLEDGNGNSSIYVKPLGMDYLMMNVYDSDKYEYFAITHGRDKYTRGYPISPDLYKPEVDRTTFRKSRWFPQELDWASINNYGYFKNPTVKFVVRDKSTNKISFPSNFRITFKNSRDIPLKADMEY